MYVWSYQLFHATSLTEEECSPAVCTCHPEALRAGETYLILALRDVYESSRTHTCGVGGRHFGIGAGPHCAPIGAQVAARP